MKKLIIVLLLSIFTISVNAQQSKIDYDYLNKTFDYLNKAKKQANAGGILMLTGIGTVVGGGVLESRCGQRQNPSQYGTESHDQTIWLPIGLLVMAGGVAIFSVGVSNLVAGSVKKGWANKHLQMTMVSFRSPGATEPINGIGIKIRF